MQPSPAPARPALPSTDRAPARAAATGPRGAEFLLATIPIAAVAAVIVGRWSSGWLLLLDTSPGPRSAPWTGPDLPVGIGLRTVVGAVAAIEPQWVGWAVPGLALVVAYAGAVRLAARWCGPDGTPASLTTRAVAGCVAVANPFVVSRVWAGQIGVLWGTALLWWLLAAVVDAAELGSTPGPARPRDRWTALAPGLWLALAASATVHLLLIGAVPVVVAGVVASRRVPTAVAARRTLLALGTGSGLTAIWLVPTLLAHGGNLGDAGGRSAAEAFASGGPVLTLWARALGGAAFWRPLPAHALDVVGLVVAAAWIATALVWRHGNGHSRTVRHVLAASALAGAVAVHLGRGPTAGAWGLAVETVWPAGLLREPGKLVMLCLPLAACGAAIAVGRVTRSSRRRSVGALAAVTLVTTGVWLGLTDRLAPSTYPAEWYAARDVTDADRCRIAVLGDGAYVNPGFTDDRIVAHPARGFFGPRAVVSNDAGMAGLPTRPGADDAERWTERTNARYLRADGPTPDATAAADAGVGWVVVDRPTDRPAISTDLAVGDLERVYRSGRIDVWRVPGGCR